MNTPRTKEARFEVFDGQNMISVVEFTFAEKLEAELQTKDAFIRSLERQVEALESAIVDEES